MVKDSKNCLKVPSAPVYTNLRGVHAKKRNAFVKIFQKVPKKPFFGLFLSLEIEFGQPLKTFSDMAT